MSSSTQAALEEQLETLRSEVAALTKTLGRRSEAAYENLEDRASGLYDYVQDRAPGVAREIRKQARYVEHTARDNPITSIAVLAGLVILIGALSRR